ALGQVVGTGFFLVRMVTPAGWRDLRSDFFDVVSSYATPAGIAAGKIPAPAPSQEPTSAHPPLLGGGATVLRALRAPTPLGPAFTGPTWDAWQVFLKAVFGLPMTDVEVALYGQHTGRTSPPTSPAREAWVVAGRRAGKSRIAAATAVYLACFRDYEHILAAGEVGTLPIIAADRRQARTVMGYVVGLLDSCPILAGLVTNRTAESLEVGRVRIEVHTASWRALRGYTVVGAVLDEVAFWRSDDSANPDVEI